MFLVLKKAGQYVDIKSDLQTRVCNWKLLFISLTKTYVVGTQKNRLNEMGFFEHPKYMLILKDNKLFTILRSKCLSWPMISKGLLLFYQIIQ